MIYVILGFAFAFSVVVVILLAQILVAARYAAKRDAVMRCDEGHHDWHEVYRLHHRSTVDDPHTEIVGWKCLTCDKVREERCCHPDP